MTVTDADILEAFEQSEAPITTAREVGEHFEMTRQWAHRRLEALADAGELEKRKPGKRTVVWWLPE